MHWQSDRTSKFHSDLRIAHGVLRGKNMCHLSRGAARWCGRSRHSRSGDYISSINLVLVTILSLSVDKMGYYGPICEENTLPLLTFSPNTFQFVAPSESQQSIQIPRYISQHSRLISLYRFGVVSINEQRCNRNDSAKPLLCSILPLMGHQQGHCIMKISLIASIIQHMKKGYRDISFWCDRFILFQHSHINDHNPNRTCNWRPWVLFV